jgi:predicted nucleic-acid-binding protein
MKMIADTNVLLRAVVGDDAQQSRVAIRAMEQAEAVVIGQHALCELVWVLDSRYGVSRANIAATIRQFRYTKNVVMDGPAVEAGLAVLEAGADFADGVIAYEGQWLGGETFVSFDKKAVTAIAKRGQQTKLLA